MTQPMNPLMRDVLLEMMGGCRHEPESYFVQATGASGWSCKKCGMETHPRNNDPLPAVGDGHEPTLEELFVLCHNLFGSHVLIHLDLWDETCRDDTVESAVCYAWLQFDGTETQVTEGPTPRLALAGTILRAEGRWTEAMRGG